MKYPEHDGPEAAPQGPVPTIFEAIVRKRCIGLTYNRVSMTMAPHVIYTKHGDLFVDGVVVDREGKPPKEYKVGTFKLTGLSELALTDRPFVTSDLYDPGSFKYADALMTVDPA
ncbi:hypothetical protein [Sphingomonas sp.]|uniref:hypothetical protein n=1 Tax=Sphingomonas sp. TaxID=28214 RepID=UPI003D6D36DD